MLDFILEWLKKAWKVAMLPDTGKYRVCLAWSATFCRSWAHTGKMHYFLKHLKNLH